MLAGIIGDVLGSVYEAHQWQRKDLPLISVVKDNPEIVPLFKESKWVRSNPSWTDDTLCTLALYHAFINKSDAKDSLLHFCNKYKSESVGFGGSFLKWLDNPVPYQSFGNGSLMRVGFFPFLHDISLTERLTLAYHYTAVSHDHPDSFESVRDFIFIVDKLGNQLNETVKDKSIIDHYLNQFSDQTVQSLHKEKVFELNAKQTFLQALVVVRESNSMEEVLRNCFYVGGDSDTLACIACNLASTIYPCPQEWLDFSLKTLEPYDDLNALVQHFKSHYWHEKY